MIKINKFENIYGIKKLECLEKFGHLNIIYAPNGTAKTSICDALENISLGKDSSVIKDRYPNATTNPSYEIDFDGDLLTENNIKPFDLIRYQGLNDYQMKEEASIANLVISKSLKKEIASYTKNTEVAKEGIYSVIKKVTKLKTDDEVNSMLSDVTGVYSENLLKKISTINFDCECFQNIDYKTFAALTVEKAQDIFSKPEVKDKIILYNGYYKKKYEDVVLDNDFTLDGLKSIHLAAIKSKFYSTAKNRCLKINNQDYYEDDIEKLITKETNMIYTSPDVKEKFDEITKEFKGSSKIINAITNHQEIFNNFIDYRTLKNNLFVSLFDAEQISVLKKYKDDLEQENEKLEELRLKGVQYNTKLDHIYQEFLDRFKTANFDLVIKNKFEAATGLKYPQIVKCIPGTKQEIHNPNELGFSTGEVRLYEFINFILEVESKIANNDKFTILLDDPVDSFDYKNKQGMLDYFITLANNPNIQLIIFTHNFDFYRNLCLETECKRRYFAYRDKNGVINFNTIDRKQDYYFQLSNFNNWKGSKLTPNRNFAYIPFARNIIQLETNSKDSDVVTIDKYLHYDNNSETLTFKDLNLVFESRLSFDTKLFAFADTDNYIKCLQKAYQKTANEYKEENLEDKVTIALYIRIFLERFLYLTILKNGQGTIPVTSKYHYTKDLINAAKSSLSNKELSVVIKAQGICPKYMHVNSFMYEPLIDISGDYLLDVAKQVEALNSKIK